MRESKVVFSFRFPHPTPLPEGEGILVPNATIRAKHYRARRPYQKIYPPKYAHGLSTVIVRIEPSLTPALLSCGRMLRMMCE